MSDEAIAEAPVVDPVAAAVAAATQEQPPAQAPEADAPDLGTHDNLILGKFKDTDSLAEAYQQAERRMHEAAQRAKEYEQILQQQQNNPPQHQPVYGEPQSADELIDLAFSDPTAAMAFAADHAEHLVPSVLAAVREYDAGRAEVLSQQWQDYKLEMRLQQALAPMQQQSQRQSVVDGYQQVAKLPGFEAVKPQIAEFIKHNPGMFYDGADAATVARGLETAYYASIGRNPEILQQAHAALAQSREQGAGGNMESQTFGSGIDIPTDDPADAVRNSIIAANKRGKF